MIVTFRFKFPVEVLRGNEWRRISGLHQVMRGERFRVLEADGSIMSMGTAAEDGRIDERGLGTVPYDFKPGDVVKGKTITEDDLSM